jgi:Hydantoinase/oxoprolinase N-terminal region
MGSREAPAADEWCTGRVTRLIHRTTVVTNAILEHKGAIIGLLGTEGSEDVLVIKCQRCSRMYDLNMEAEAPVFLAPRRRGVGTGKRLHLNGEVLGPRNGAQVIEAVHTLKACDATPAMAVCYLFSCKNPSHERRARELVRGTFPAGGHQLGRERRRLFKSTSDSAHTLSHRWMVFLALFLQTILSTRLSRWRVGWCGFSTRLLRESCWRCSTPGRMSRFAAPPFLSLSIMMTRGM